MPTRALIFTLFVTAVSACTDRELPTAATPIAGPSPAAVTPALPTTVPGVLGVNMPIDAGDLANAAFGMTPFGYHDASHAEEGHSGWDIEYRIGAPVRAAAAGTVQTVSPDSLTGSRSTVILEHLVGAHHYRTVYTNLSSVNAEIVPAAAVRSGQPIGVAGTQSQFVGRIPVIYAMTHFQLDDLEFHREGSDPKAVSPEPFLSSDARFLFERMWSTAAFFHELVEPFPGNPRNLSFPVSRTWIKAGGDGPPGIRFTRRTSRDPVYEYALLAESGTVFETGTVSLSVTARPFPTIDLFAATAVRLGVYDIVSGEMRLALADPGTDRPAGLAAASVYRTSR